MDAVAFGSIQGKLQDAEESGAAGDGKGDKLELAEHFVPVVVADPTFALELCKDLYKLLAKEIWQFDGLSHGVNDPAQDAFPCSPAAISFEELLQQDCFISVGFVSLGLCEDLVHSMEQMVLEGIHLAFAPLPKLDEVINVDIRCAHRPQRGPARFFQLPLAMSAS